MASEVPAGHAAHFPGVGDEWVELYGLRGVGFGAGVVLEVVFGNGAQKVRLGQVGFGVDYAVEVLDGQHVVLEVERVAPHAQHLLGVDLSGGRHSSGRE